MRPLRIFLSHWQNWLGLIIVLFFAVVALAQTILSPQNATAQGWSETIGNSYDSTPRPPSKSSILGTLPGQIDVYHALIWGARDAMIFGLSVAIGALIFGSFFGAVSGYAGGAVNNVMMRIADAFLTFPVLAGVVFLQQLVFVTIESEGGSYILGRLTYTNTPPPITAFLMSVDPILISLIIFSWMPVARLVNTMVITLKNTEFIQAARALGGSPFWIIRHHLLPNAVQPAIVLAARDVGSSVILQATITTIGLGGSSPWGMLLSLGRGWVIGPGGNLFAYWWIFLPVTLAIVFFGIGWNLLGDGLSEALEPTAIAHGDDSFSKHKQKKMDVGAVVAVHRSHNPDTLLSLPSPSSLPLTRIPIGSPPELDPLLQTARIALARQDLELALHAYSHLTKHGRQLHAVTHDLAQAAERFPRYAQIWKALGDVLAQTGNYEYAVKAYKQFRKLTQ